MNSKWTCDNTGGKLMLPRLILVFLSVDWPIFSRRPMLSALARAAKEYGTTVVAVNRPLCPASTLFRKPGRFVELLQKPKLAVVSENLYLYSPKYFLHDRKANRHAMLQNLNIFALRHSIARLQERLDLFDTAPVIWYYHPQQAYVSKLFEQSFNIFELYDNLTDVYGVSDPIVLKWESDWKTDIDLFLATSPKLLQTYGSGYVRTRSMKNGLANEHYLRLSSPRNSIGGSLDHIPHPRLGFAGVISERLDWKLILGLAEARPDWHLVFAGRITHDRYLSKMKSCRNIHYVGEFSLDQISAIIADFDLGIMPYIDNDFFRFSNPLKFYETCAAGVPSVSSPMEILNDFPSDVVRICSGGVVEWVTAITSMLGGHNSKTEILCKQIASEHTWEAICAELLDDLQTYRRSGSTRNSSSYPRQSC